MTRKLLLFAVSPKALEIRLRVFSRELLNLWPFKDRLKCHMIEALRLELDEREMFLGSSRGVYRPLHLPSCRISL